VLDDVTGNFHRQCEWKSHSNVFESILE
jgi:hypothetical protein